MSICRKLLRNRKLFKDILTFLGVGYGDGSLIKLYFVVLGISIQKSDYYFTKNMLFKKVKKQHS